MNASRPSSDAATPTGSGAARRGGVLPADRRRRLLDTAVREFADAGYQRASLNRIIRTCGMSKSSFYYYVDSKDALFDMVVDELGGALFEAIDPPEPGRLAGADFWDRLGALVRRLTELGRTDPRFFAFGRLFALPDAPGEPGRPLARAREGINEWLRAALGAGRAAGVVRDDLPPSLQAELVLAVLWAMDSWSVRRMHDGEINDPERLVDAQVDALRRLLAPEGPREP